MKQTKLQQLLLDALEYFDEFEYPFPKGEWLADSWKDQIDGVKTGLDDEIEVAENIIEYLQKSVDFAEKHPEVMEDDPAYEIETEYYYDLKREHDKAVKMNESLLQDLVREKEYMLRVLKRNGVTSQDLDKFLQEKGYLLGDVLYRESVYREFLDFCGVDIMDVRDDDLDESINRMDIQSEGQYNLKDLFESKTFTLGELYKLSEQINNSIPANRLYESLYDYDGESEYEFVDHKSVLDSDGFYTDYTMYKTPDDHFVFVFGDRDIYRPEDGDFDYECDSEKEAREWFDSYNGFDEEDEEDDWEDDFEDDDDSMTTALDVEDGITVRAYLQSNYTGLMVDETFDSMTEVEDKAWECVTDGLFTEIIDEDKNIRKFDPNLLDEDATDLKDVEI